MKYHFIGIGGISMSGLAALMANMGYEITGCDLKKYKNQNLNFKVWEGHNRKHITADLAGVVVTAAALHESSPAKEELDQARKLKIPIIKRSEMIGNLMGKPGMVGIAISGMHGKTTVSTMISLILEKAGLDPIALIGSGIKEWNGKNYRYGKGKYFIAEACEYDRQMLDFRPKIEVITNLDEEHLDTYPKGLMDIKQAFGRFVRRLPKKNGLLVVWLEDKNLMQVAQIAKKRGNKVYEVSIKKIWPGLKLKIPGKHNLLNATFAARVCHEIGISNKIIKEVLSNFTGASRRFEIKGKKNGITVVDDYGHHPTEIKAVIKAAKEYLENSEFKTQNSKLIVVFQPHQYIRTKLLFDDFKKAFIGVDKLIVTDIYLIAGREPNEARADLSKKLVAEIKKLGIDAIYAPTYNDAFTKLKKVVQKNDLILTLGATNIYQVGEKFLQ